MEHRTFFRLNIYSRKSWFPFFIVIFCLEKCFLSKKVNFVSKWSFRDISKMSTTFSKCRRQFSKFCLEKIFLRQNGLFETKSQKPGEWVKKRRTRRAGMDEDLMKIHQYEAL